MYQSYKQFPSRLIHLKPQYPLIVLSSVLNRNIVRIIRICAFLPTRNESVDSNSIQFWNRLTLRRRLSCYLVAEDLLKKVVKVLEKVILGRRPSVVEDLLLQKGVKVLEKILFGLRPSVVEDLLLQKVVKLLEKVIFGRREVWWMSWIR
ncbi:hypothetical protein NPIL_3771 [Nephila pilipes]|uniref:Uncharacterized protein n=1 Tax=Nephila pilipes TaxID=299642 RepID=A0A8X6T133_NEPPI|nr:hypothetical protein NPIL_3771 [Nephila pilipes]